MYVYTYIYIYIYIYIYTKLAAVRSRVAEPAEEAIEKLNSLQCICEYGYSGE